MYIHLFQVVNNHISYLSNQHQFKCKLHAHRNKNNLGIFKDHLTEISSSKNPNSQEKSQYAQINTFLYSAKDFFHNTLCTNFLRVHQAILYPPELLALLWGHRRTFQSVSPVKGKPRIHAISSPSLRPLVSSPAAYADQTYTPPTTGISI